MSTPLADNNRPSPVGHVRRRSPTVAIAALGITVTGYVAYGCAALVRIGALDDWVHLVVGFNLLALLWFAAQKKPFAITFLLLTILPLFGNHPGGRYMEFVNLPLAASAAGLIATARREQRPAPDGPIWRMAFLYLLTAIIATVPTLPRVAVRAVEINSPMLFVTEALTAPEDDVLYSISSLVLLTLAVIWAFALSWAGAAHRFTVNTYRVLTIALFGVTGIGISDYFGLTSVGRSYVRLIDARSFHFVGLQSIFWHPGWFGWYFVIVFGIALGLWTIEPRGRRLVLGSGILLCYLFFFLNPERGGLIAVHGVLLLFAWYSIRRAEEPRRSSQRLIAIILPVLILAAGMLSTPAGRSAIARANLLSLERTVNSAREFLQSDGEGNFRASERLKLWSAATRMWLNAPAFGIGEGSFAWRFHDYVPAGSALDTPSHADAHSLWFQLLATRGIAGATAYVLLLLAVARALWARWQDPVTGPHVTGLVLALAGFVTYSFVYALFYLQPIQLLFWLITAFAVASTPAGSQTSDRFRWGVGVGCAIALLVQLATVQPLYADVLANLAHQPRGFYPVEIGPEGAHKRWSSASGVLCLNPSAVRVRLRFEAVDPRVRTLPRTVTLNVDGREVDRFEIGTAEVVTRGLELPAPYSHSEVTLSFGECTPESRRLLISVNRTWSPTDAGFNADPRHLGVLVFEPIYLFAAPDLLRQGQGSSIDFSTVDLSHASRADERDEQPAPLPCVRPSDRTVRSRVGQGLGGLLRYYHRPAA
jgi:O-antigen ligase